MSEPKSYTENDELCDESDSFTTLSDHLSLFLKNSEYVAQQGDERVLFYRGQSDKTYSLTPSVFRKGLLGKERELIHEMLINSPYEFSNIENRLERLIKMQHYGLPTRLLDVTTNPLVAMFFACKENQDRDGEILIFYDYMQHPSFVDARSLAELAEYSGSSERQIFGFLTERGFNNLEVGRIANLTHIPIKAPMNNERIRRQHGAFLMVGLHGGKNDNVYQKSVFDLKPHLIKKFDDDIERSIIIPKSSKGLLLKELETFGINKAFLFPELEHQAEYIRKKYEEV